MGLVGLCALHLLAAACSSDHDPIESSSRSGAANAGAGDASGGGQPEAGRAGAGVAGAAGVAAVAGRGGAAGSAAGGSSASSAGSPGTAGQTVGGANAGPPPAVDGRSVYALECHGDSKDCNRAAVPCFGVSSQTPNVAAGWACANRCARDADCSDAPSGAQAQAACVSFASTGHCMLVCQNENESSSCPDGMGCYVPPKSPVGYCLWQ